MHPMAGIVLAGGQSKRMGRDKAGLEWQGTSLLVHMRELLKQAGAAPVRISGDYPALGGIVDEVAQCGPLGGLYSVAATLADGPVLVVPVDMPLLQVETLALLRDAPPAACVTFHDEPFPMRIHLDAASRRLLRKMVLDINGPKAMRAFQTRLGLRTLTAIGLQGPQLMNCNTPEQWRALSP